MSVDDFDFDDDDDEVDGGLSSEEGGGAAEPEQKGLRNWLNARRGWVIIIAITIMQGLFATIMIMLRSSATPVREVELQTVQDLAVEMLGHEVAVRQIYQLLPASGGKRMTIGLDIVLVLGQLPEERIEGAPRPTPLEFDAFIQAIQDMEPRIRSQVNSLLQGIPARDYGSVEVYTVIKDQVKDYTNDSLERLDFGRSVRPEISKRRVTEVLLPMFVRQMY